MNVVRNAIVGTIATVLVIALLAVIFVGEDARMGKAAEAQQGQLIARGARLYDQYCSGCHGKRGEGLAGVYPALNVRDMWEGRENIAFYGTLHDYISLNIAAGHPSQRMPSWSEKYGGPLRDDQIEDLAQFVLNWQGEQPEGVRPEEGAPTPTAGAEATPAATPEPAAEGDPAHGQEVFLQSCANCHGENAQGGSLGPTLVSSDVAANDDEYFRQIIVNGRAGTAMPAWGDILSAQDIADVIAWLRTKQ
ncbi:MAG: c-type cytochrome [Anaerolineae bacterium]|jgi:mono/diheme cytochrome c family protein